MVSESRKAANKKWDKANMANLACSVRKDIAAEFREYCKTRGKTVHAVLYEYVLACIGKNQLGGNEAVKPGRIKTAEEKIELEGLTEAQPACAEASGQNDGSDKKDETISAADND